MKTTVKYITNIITEQDIGKLVRIYSPHFQCFPYTSNSFSPCVSDSFYKIVALTGNRDVVLESCDDLRADIVRGKNLRDGLISFEIHEEIKFSEDCLNKLLDLVPFIPNLIYVGHNQYSSLAKSHFNAFNYRGNSIQIKTVKRDNYISFDGKSNE